MAAVLHVISDRQRNRRPLIESLVASVRAGADYVQIREKRAPAGDTYQLARDLQGRLQDLVPPANVIVNDRMDIAMAANLQGVHLAAKSLPVAVACAVRQRSDWQGLIGCSVHDLQEARRAEQAGADYVTFGHIFPTASHVDLPARGLAGLRAVVAALSIPVLAIGGIEVSNVRSVLETGCSGVAVIGAVLDADDPYTATGDLREAMTTSHIAPKISFGKSPG